MSRLAIAGSNPTEAADVLGNLKVSSNIYAMNYLGIGASNTNVTSNLSLEVFGNAKMNNNLEVVGNLSVRGTTTTVESTVVNIADNIIRVNNGAAYNSAMQAGLEINRGTGYSNYYLVFDEPSQYFKIGQTGSVQAVATRDDSIPVNAVTVYDLTNRKFTGCNTFVYSNDALGVGTASPSEMLDVTKNIKANSNIYAMSRIGIATSNPQVALEINATDAVLLPKGTTLQRPTIPVQGHVRYNLDINTFEGFGAGNAWGSLGGVKDTNQDTYISAESYPTSNDDILRFYNSNNETMRVMPTGRIGISNQAPSERLEVSGGNAKLNSNLYVLQNLSVGKSNPAYPLDVYGNAAVDGSVTTTKYVLSRGIQVKKRNAAYFSDTTLPSGVLMGFSNDTLGVNITMQSNTPENYFRFLASSNEVLRITGNGYIGVNTSIPTEYLQVQGNVYATNQLLGNSNDSALIPSFSFKEDSNTGIFHASNDAIGFSTNGTEKMRITTTGNVGIGIINPMYPLDVVGDVNFTGILRKNGEPYIGSQWSNNSTNVFLLGSNVSIGSATPSYPLDVTGVIRATSNIYAGVSLGIGNSNPGYPLDVTGDLNFTGILRKNGAPYIGSQWSNNSSNVFLLGSNVGIGTSTPSYPLDVTGNINCSGNISAGNLGMFRNRIINGDMRINQRGATSYVCALSTNTYSVDRMTCYNGGGTSTVTVQTLSSSDAPAALGFNNSIRFTSNSTAISLIQPGHYIEGINISDFRWGTTNASPVVLSFWLKSNSAFTLSVSLRNAIAGGTWTGYVTTVSSTTSWNYYTIQIQGATIGSWNTNTSTGVEIFIGGYSGVAGVSTMNVWSNNSGSISSTTSTRWDQTVGNYIEFTGLQLEKGTIATPFEFRPYAIELQLCQRYYELIGLYGWMGTYNGGTAICAALKFIVPKRSTPSVSLIGTIAFTQPTHANYVWPTSSTSINRTDYTLYGCMVNITQTNSALYMTSSSIFTIIPGFTNGYNNTNVFAVSDEL
jgi:hypothetical protein